MPTPVSTARECLTDEAARVLDDAVAVARRRCHAQITSLHAVSVLLSLPSSLLRDACSRARSPSFSPRLQFRALDLCVSVALDRLPSSKASAGVSSYSSDEPPPVSNSLMAAIKRSQANQRRQPEMYQDNQHATSPICSISTIRVELKNFVISILDDPIVSRVLGDAGLRSTDIKLAILHPPPPSPASLFRGAGSSGGRFPPLFLCNLADSGSPMGGNLRFPFSRGSSGEISSQKFNGDGNCRRIGEILTRSSGRDPLLVGVCARDALATFKECVNKVKGEGVLPSEIVGLDLFCLEKEIVEFLSVGGSKETVDSKMDELSSSLQRHSGPGVVVSFGELNAFVENDGVSEDAVKFLLSKLSSLLEVYRKKMWLIGVAADYEMYRRFLDRYPFLEADWDLHPLPITSSRSLEGKMYSKSRLMGSFVPFAGLFPSPSDFRDPSSQPFRRCSRCNEKYERELSAIAKGGSSVSVADKHSSCLPSWLLKANSDVDKPRDPAVEIPDEQAEHAQILVLQRKWDDTCKRIHEVPTIPRPDLSMANPTSSCSLGFPLITSKQRSKSGTFSSNDHLDSGVSAMTRGQTTKAVVPSSEPDSAPKVSHTSFSTSSVLTDHGLGTLASTSQELMKTDSYANEKDLDRTDQGGEYKDIVLKLTEKVARQIEACYEVGRIISRCGDGNLRQNTWIGFTGPDVMGKKTMAKALTETLFGSSENLVAIDLSAHERMNEPYSIFETQITDDIGLLSGRRTAVDYIAEKLRNKPRPVVFLENLDKTDDLLTQRSLSCVIQTGRFPDSRGREINVANAIFLTTCSSTKEEHNDVKFSEEKVLKALNWQMQIVIEHAEGETPTANKRKQNLTDEPLTSKKPKGFLDLNLPIGEETTDDAEPISDSSRAWLQDFLRQVSRMIVFKPLNFDGLANQLLKKMRLSLEKKLGSGFELEVDEDVMTQVLAAVWRSYGDGVVDVWIEEVLGGTFAEAERRYGLRSQARLRLVSCPGVPVELHACGVRLPKAINLG